jgi:glycosyltransferase involved in cell wall biosynthesis
LNCFNIRPKQYVLTVGRLVPEKNHFDLVRAFEGAGMTEWKLLIVGGADHVSEYSEQLLALFKGRDDIIFAGVQSKEALAQLYENAGLFVLPSSHEGLPIALLEAMSFGIPILASDIPANLEIGLDQRHYFPVSNVPALRKKLQDFSRAEWTSAETHKISQYALRNFDWAAIARRTLECYNKVYAGQAKFHEPNQK